MATKKPCQVVYSLPKSLSQDEQIGCLGRPMRPCRKKCPGPNSMNKLFVRVTKFFGHRVSRKGTSRISSTAFVSARALPPINVELLRREPETMVNMDTDAHVCRFLRVLPTGLPWAFHLAHKAHAELALRALPHSVQVRAHHAAPVMGTSSGRCNSAMLVYAGNANYLGVSREQVDAEQKKMRDALHCPGLETHDAQQGIVPTFVKV